MTNARLYGVVGDGRTDDTAALQRALDATATTGGIVFLPPGLSIVSNTIYIPNKVVLRGVGRDSNSGIKASASFPTDGPLVRLGKADEPIVFGCRIEDIVIDANSRATVGIYSSAANEQSGAKNCVVIGFTQYGIHFDGCSIVAASQLEVYPQADGATTGIYLESCAGDNLIERVTIGVSGTLTNGMHIQSSQAIATSVHVEYCTTGINIDDSSVTLIGISGPTSGANVTDLIAVQGNTRYSIAQNVQKNDATRLLTDYFAGVTNADAYMPLWVGGDSIWSGAVHMARTDVYAQLTANLNDAPFSSSAQIVRVSSDAARDITGIAAGNVGRVLWVYNAGSFNITLKHQSASSVAGNRIIGRSNADTVLAPGQSCMLHLTDQWRVMS